MGSPKAASQKQNPQTAPNRDEILSFLVEHENLPRTLSHFGLTKPQLKDLLLSPPPSPLPSKPGKSSDLPMLEKAAAAAAADSTKKTSKSLPSASLPLFGEPPLPSTEPPPQTPTAKEAKPSRTSKTAALAAPPVVPPPSLPPSSPKGMPKKTALVESPASESAPKSPPPKRSSLQEAPSRLKAEATKAEAKTDRAAEPKIPSKPAPEEAKLKNAPLSSKAESRSSKAESRSSKAESRSSKAESSDPLEPKAPLKPESPAPIEAKPTPKASPKADLRPENPSLKAEPKAPKVAPEPLSSKEAPLKEEKPLKEAKKEPKAPSKKAASSQETKKTAKARKPIDFDLDEDEIDEDEIDEADEISSDEIDVELPRKPSRRQSAPRGRRTFILEPEHTIYQRLLIYTDGAARGNPGESGAGVVLKTPEGEEVGRFGRYLGRKTNNHAEYEAVLLGLRHAREFGAVDVTILSDSELLVRQLLGEYRVRAIHLRELFQEVKQMLSEFEKHQIKRIGREKNIEADSMSNRAIDEKL